MAPSSRGAGAALLLVAAAGGAGAVVVLQELLRRRRRRQGEEAPGDRSRPVPRHVRRLRWQQHDGEARGLCRSEAARPFALAGAPLGRCSEAWTDEYLKASLGDFKISAHVSPSAGLDFVAKNFVYRVMPLREFLRLVRRGDGDQQYYYYRSEHTKRNKPSSLEVLGPLARDFGLPAALLDGLAVHSTVLRIASAGMRMWLHYDVCDNFLCCVRGRKRVLLFPPRDVGRLYIGSSSSALGSRLLDPAETGSPALWREFPLAREPWEARYEVLLEEGEVLFIPAMWPHCTEACPLEGERGGVCISVNLFFIRPERAALHDPKDIWANRELLPAQEAMKGLDALRRLPREARSFYCLKAAAALAAMAAEDESSGEGAAPAAS